MSAGPLYSIAAIMSRQRVGRSQLLSGVLDVSTEPIALSGSIDAVSTIANAALDVALTVSGTIDAVSTINGTLSLDNALSGSVDLVSTINGELGTAGQHDISGSIDCVSTINGTLDVESPAVATVIPFTLQAIKDKPVKQQNKRSQFVGGVLDVSTSTSTEHALSGSVDIVSTINGDLSVESAVSLPIPFTLRAVKPQPSLKKIPSVMSALAGVLSLSTDQVLSGTIDAVSTINADLAVAKSLSGSVDAVSTIKGSVALENSLSGAVDLASSISAGLTMAYTLSGAVDAVLTINGELLTQGQISMIGQVDAVSTIDGALTVDKPISGSIDCVSTINGSFASVIDLSGSIDCAMGIACRAELDNSLSCAVEITSTIDATLSAAWVLAGSCDWQSVIACSLSVQGLVGEPYKIFECKDLPRFDAEARAFTFESDDYRHIMTFSG